jgi:hypothetical protein
MRVRLLFACLFTCFGVFVSALPSQPAQAVAQTGFTSLGVASTSYSMTFHQLGFTFLTNSTVDELVSVNLRLSGSSPVTVSLYNSDASDNRGTFITDIATVTLGAEQDYSFVPSTQILLQPNSYYWIQTSLAGGAFGLNNSMTSDYYTFGSTQLYVVSSGTWTPIPTFSRSSIQIDTLDTLPVVLLPDLTALGCVLTQEVLAPTAPDNTYCRVLMKNGAVIGYSGAVPRGLIDLGVIFAVDVYRLEGGRSITTFPNYTQICVAGQGRLFYLDARTSPRVQTELSTESVDGFTCGWIPAVGTLVLTN